VFEDGFLGVSRLILGFVQAAIEGLPLEQFEAETYTSLHLALQQQLMNHASLGQSKSKFFGFGICPGASQRVKTKLDQHCVIFHPAASASASTSRIIAHPLRPLDLAVPSCCCTHFSQSTIGTSVADMTASVMTG
jgi:hypothetical protein